MHLKKLTRLVDFCVAILILKIKEYATLSVYYALLFQERLKCKERCAVCGEGAVTDQTRQKWFAKFLGTIEIFAK